MRRTTTSRKISEQRQRRAEEKTKKIVDEVYEGSDQVVSTSSTLLDLAISGGRFRGGGVPCGILVEIFGPSQCGKTVLLSALAGRVLAAGGSPLFHDPEARLNKQFARLFDLDMDQIDYTVPDTIPQVFSKVRKWKPSSPPYGIFADSLAALSTDLEMATEDGDKMGGRRAKEFSQELRRTCRVLTQKNFLMVCSNQIRQNMNAGPFGAKYTSPGGEAIGFYSSLRLQGRRPTPIIQEEEVGGKKIKLAIGVTTEFYVFKSTVWKPYRSAPVTILFDHGIDDVRQNLQFIKNYTDTKVYTLGEKDLAQSMNDAISIIEEDNLEANLREEVIDLWEKIDVLFSTNRKKRVYF